MGRFRRSVVEPSVRFRLVTVWCTPTSGPKVARMAGEDRVRRVDDIECVPLMPDRGRIGAVTSDYLVGRFPGRSADPRVEIVGQGRDALTLGCPGNRTRVRRVIRLANANASASRLLSQKVKAAREPGFTRGVMHRY